MNDLPQTKTAPNDHAPSSPASPRPAFGSPWPVLLALGLLALATGALVRPDVVERSRNRGYARVTMAQSGMRSLATALESYAVDNDAFPPSAVGTRGVNGWVPRDSPVARVPTFALSPGGGPYLTTPVAYISQIPRDPFSLVGGATFGYYSTAGWWVLFSPGPDGEYDLLDPSDLVAPGKQFPDKGRTAALTYDPSNGTISRGDILRFSSSFLP